MSETWLWILLLLKMVILILGMAIIGGYLVRINLRKSKEVTEKVTSEIIIGVFAGIAAVYLISIRDLLLSTKPFTWEFWAYLAMGISGLIFIIGIGTTAVRMIASRKP